jgi:hypothetical protein
MNLPLVRKYAILLSMAKQKRNYVNWLEHYLPEGLLVDAAWLADQGYSTSLRTQYVAAGWLTQPARRVYQRPRGQLAWQQIVISLQTLLARDLIIGGRTALDLHGLGHYLQQSTTRVFLHGPKPPPTWLADLPGAWREGMRELLGIVPTDDVAGCLQDIHWPDGGWGYFPTYTLGALAAAQLFAAANKAHPGLMEAIGKGNFAPLLAWLRLNVHGKGSIAGTDEILNEATGAPLGVAAFKVHLESRYLSA